MRATVLSATVMVGLAGAAGASTVEPGYMWAADDGSLSFTASVDPGEDFYDALDEAADGSESLLFQFGFMLSADFASLGVLDDGLFVALSQEEFDVPPIVIGDLECPAVDQVTRDAYLSFDGLLTISSSTRHIVADVPGCPDGAPSDTAFEYIPGEWTAVGGAPAYPFPAAVPLPASGALLAFGLLGLIGASRLRR